jgi:hypothetical protein
MFSAESSQKLQGLLIVFRFTRPAHRTICNWNLSSKGSLSLVETGVLLANHGHGYPMWILASSTKARNECNVMKQSVGPVNLRKALEFSFNLSLRHWDIYLQNISWLNSSSCSQWISQGRWLVLAGPCQYPRTAAALSRDRLVPFPWLSWGTQRVV